MVWPIIGEKSYVSITGKSMKGRWIDPLAQAGYCPEADRRFPSDSGTRQFRQDTAKDQHARQLEESAIRLLDTVNVPKKIAQNDTINDV
jgi:hypothetical protein